MTTLHSVEYCDPQVTLERAQERALYQHEGCAACGRRTIRRGVLACDLRLVPVLGWCPGFDSSGDRSE